MKSQCQVLFSGLPASPSSAEQAVWQGGLVKVQWDPRASSPGGLSDPVCLSPAALQSVQTVPSRHLTPKRFLDQALQMLALGSSSISKALLGGDVSSGLRKKECSCKRGYKSLARMLKSSDVERFCYF